LFWYSPFFFGDIKGIKIRPSNSINNTPIRNTRRRPIQCCCLWSTSSRVINKLQCRNR
jgi:hypothetical protein